MLEIPAVVLNDKLIIMEGLGVRAMRRQTYGVWVPGPNVVQFEDWPQIRVPSHL